MGAGVIFLVFDNHQYHAAEHDLRAERHRQHHHAHTASPQYAADEAEHAAQPSQIEDHHQHDDDYDHDAALNFSYQLLALSC